MTKLNKYIVLASLGSVVLTSSCVTLGKYEALETKNAQIKKEMNVLRSELKDMKDENAELLRQNQALQTDYQDLMNTKNDQTVALSTLRHDYDAMKLSYDTIIEGYMQQISGKNRDLQKANMQLAARTKELNDREIAFQVKETELLNKQAALELRQVELQDKETAAKRALAAKEKELESVRNAVNKALVGFADKGLNVETKDGKVYVSMESKLMFPSASWVVSKEGLEALKGLAKVLEENQDLNIMVEGHTDNDKYKGSSAVKDNWDLSVMRATAIVKTLLEYGKGIDPQRVIAAGHSEFSPKVPNTSVENKAQNRRTEIILTPRLDDILKMVK